MNHENTQTTTSTTKHGETKKMRYRRESKAIHDPNADCVAVTVRLHGASLEKYRKVIERLTQQYHRQPSHSMAFEDILAGYISSLQD